MVITYQGKLIDPVYHSTSNGKTENSGEIWKFDIPYLKSVESIWDLESPKYEASVSYPLKEVEQRLGVNLQMKNSGTALPLQILEKTTGGRIRRIKAGEKEFTGEEFRRLLGLPSADCSWRLEGDLVVFSPRLWTWSGSQPVRSQWDGQRGKNFGNTHLLHRSTALPGGQVGNFFRKLFLCFRQVLTLDLSPDSI